MASRKYSASEKLFIKSNRHLNTKDLHSAFVKKFRWVTVGSLRALCYRNRWLSEKTPTEWHTQYSVGDVMGMTYGGFRRVKVGFSKNGNPLYRSEQAYLWEKKHGKIPKGYVLKCKTEDKFNAYPSNWLLIPRGVSYRIARVYGESFYKLSPEFQDLALTSARLGVANYRSKRGIKL